MIVDILVDAAIDDTKDGAGVVGGEGETAGAWACACAEVAQRSSATARRWKAKGMSSRTEARRARCRRLERNQDTQEPKKTCQKLNRSDGRVAAPWAEVHYATPRSDEPDGVRFTFRASEQSKHHIIHLSLSPHARGAPNEGRDLHSPVTSRKYTERRLRSSS